MNKLKLIQMIEKDLDELKTLTTEVAESEGNSSLTVSLALARVKLLCQEIELLQDLTKSTEPLSGEEPLAPETDEDNQETAEAYPEPELEIVNYEENESIAEPEGEIGTDEPEDEDIVYDSDEDFEEEEPEMKEEESEDLEIAEQEIKFETDLPETLQDEEIPENDYSEPEAEPEEAEPENEDSYVDPHPEQPVVGTLDFEEVHLNEIKDDHHANVREIQIEDLDDEEEPTLFSPVSKTENRLVMHEIPKPESEPREKQVLGESFTKEPSLNDVMAENKSAETNIGNGPISSLKSSIGLNDRFLFIREIFNNNTDKYNTIIDHLDKLETIQQAVDYLKANLTLQKNETSLKFVDLLKRRFLK